MRGIEGTGQARAVEREKEAFESRTKHILDKKLFERHRGTSRARNMWCRVWDLRPLLTMSKRGGAAVLRKGAGKPRKKFLRWPPRPRALGADAIHKRARSAEGSARLKRCG